MSTDPHDKADVEKRLWKEVEDARFGMLGLVGSHQHFQPMTAFAEPETGQIWFFTRDDTDLAQAVTADGGDAMFVVQAKDGDFQACIGGRLSRDHDTARIQRCMVVSVGLCNRWPPPPRPRAGPGPPPPPPPVA